MMAVAVGLERTEADYRRLFAAHGFRLARRSHRGEASVIDSWLA
jgi:hypothetical protein